MSTRKPASQNVLPFHTAHWFARERAAKRLEQLLDEHQALTAWLDRFVPGDTQERPLARYDRRLMAAPMRKE